MPHNAGVVAVFMALVSAALAQSQGAWWCFVALGITAALGVAAGMQSDQARSRALCWHAVACTAGAMIGMALGQAGLFVG